MKPRLIALTLACAVAAWGQTRPPASNSGAVYGNTGQNAKDGIGGADGARVRIAVGGRILLEDKTPPPDPVPVQLICVAGSGRGDVPDDNSTVTDAKGRFAIPVGFVYGRDLMSSGARLRGCEVVVRAGGFETWRKDLGQMVGPSGLDAGVIVLKRTTAHGDGVTLSSTSRQAPDRARREFVAALNDIYEKRIDEARGHLNKSVALYPGYATAWFTIATLEDRTGSRDAARSAYKKAADADPLYINPRLQLAQIAAEESDWAAAESWAADVVRLSPGEYPNMYIIRAGAAFNRGDAAAAQRFASEGIQSESGDREPRLHLLLGEACARLKKYDEASQQFNRYLSLAPDAPDAAEVRTRSAALARLATVK